MRPALKWILLILLQGAEGVVDMPAGTPDVFNPFEGKSRLQTHMK